MGQCQNDRWGQRSNILMGQCQNGRWGQRLNILMWQCHNGRWSQRLYFGKGDNTNVLHRRCTYFHFPSISFINSFKTSSCRWNRPEVMTSVIIQIGKKKVLANIDPNDAKLIRKTVEILMLCQLPVLCSPECCNIFIFGQF